MSMTIAESVNILYMLSGNTKNMTAQALMNTIVERYAKFLRERIFDVCPDPLKYPTAETKAPAIPNIGRNANDSILNPIPKAAIASAP